MIELVRALLRVVVSPCRVRCSSWTRRSGEGWRRVRRRAVGSGRVVDAVVGKDRSIVVAVGEGVWKVSSLDWNADSDVDVVLVPSVAVVVDVVVAVVGVNAAVVIAVDESPPHDSSLHSPHRERYYSSSFRVD